MNHVHVDQVKNIKNVVEVYKKKNSKANIVNTAELAKINFFDLNKL